VPRSEDICYATSNRQAAVKGIAGRCDAVLVIGAPNSSNSVRLVEVAERAGARSMLVGRGHDVDFAWLEGVQTLGITAGASAPEVLVREVVDRIAERYTITEEPVDGVEESIVFKLPPGLEPARAA
jgi:4-hydroxy-3-methylbut-2-enyl diphosphate reductase